MNKYEEIIEKLKDLNFENYALKQQHNKLRDECDNLRKEYDERGKMLLALNINPIGMTLERVKEINDSWQNEMDSLGKERDELRADIERINYVLRQAGYGQGEIDDDIAMMITGLILQGDYFKAECERLREACKNGLIALEHATSPNEWMDIKIILRKAITEKGTTDAT